MFELRLAVASDSPALEALIQRSGMALSAGFYTPEQAQAITKHVFGVDSQLVADGTYFVVEHLGSPVACGGWSKRRTLCGGDRVKSGPDPLIDPSAEPARIRAFFVEPSMARRGLGRMLMDRCIGEALLAGFRSMELIATLPGEPLYVASGFKVLERFELSLPPDIRVPVTRMALSLTPAEGCEAAAAQGSATTGDRSA